MKTGAILIQEERWRQMAQEGWTAEHDDGHQHGELAFAGASYALPFQLPAGEVPGFWPFEKESYKPTPNDRVRELTKAGALIAAEIDRLQRLTPNT